MRNVIIDTSHDKTREIILEPGLDATNLTSGFQAK